MKKRKLCLFCEKWESGGIESFLYNVLTHSDLTDLEVDLVAAQLAESVFTAPLEALGVRFLELSGSQRRLGENHRRFRALLRQRQYDAVYLNVFQALSLFYAKLASEAGVPVRIAHSHNTALRASLTQPLKLSLHRWAQKRYTRYATHLRACSRAAAEFLFDPAVLKEQGFTFIPNGIDVSRFRFDPEGRAKCRCELGVGDALVIGSVGRLCEQKNQSFLLEVFSQVQAMRPDSLLLLVGEGEDREKLMEQAEVLGVKDKVLFYGVTDTVERLFWAMDVFAFPSLFEGLGIVAVEAQAAGLAVICSENVPEEAHITRSMRTVPLTDGPQAWAEALLNTSPPKRQLGAEEVKAAGFDITDAPGMMAF